MRFQPFFAVLLSTTLFSGLAAAQNYVPAKNYNNPDVVVNMDVIGATGRPAPIAPIVPPAPMAIAPVLNAPLPPLVPPAAMTERATRAPVQLAAPLPAEEAIPEIPPVREAVMDSPPPLAKMPPPPALTAPSFSAREMALSAPVPVAPAPVAPPPQKSPEANPARELLAAAREKAASPPVATEKPREVVIFDEAPVLPKPAENLAEPAPMPLAPPAMVKEIIPVEKSPSVAAPEEFDTAMLKPAALDETGKNPTGATLVDDFEAYRLNFGANSADLDPSEKAVLDKIAAKVKAEEKTRLQLRAYADGTPDTASSARRLSLSRALAVRSYLSEKGVPASRLDVRALGVGSAAMGDAVNRGAIPADRVDVIFIR